MVWPAPKLVVENRRGGKRRVGTKGPKWWWGGERCRGVGDPDNFIKGGHPPGAVVSQIVTEKAGNGYGGETENSIGVGEGSG